MKFKAKSSQRGESDVLALILCKCCFRHTMIGTFKGVEREESGPCKTIPHNSADP
jgi:hypothetical protein